MRRILDISERPDSFHRAVLFVPNKDILETLERCGVRSNSPFTTLGFALPELSVFIYRHKKFDAVVPTELPYWEVSTVGDRNVIALQQFLFDQNVKTYIEFDVERIEALI
jgi:hypothetical protein